VNFTSSGSFNESPITRNAAMAQFAGRAFTAATSSAIRNKLLAEGTNANFKYSNGEVGTDRSEKLTGSRSPHGTGADFSRTKARAHLEALLDGRRRQDASCRAFRSECMKSTKAVEPRTVAHCPPVSRRTAQSAAAARKSASLEIRSLSPGGAGCAPASAAKYSRK
jgi:hypothetical protein